MAEKKGMVYIIGAGPGDPELITVKGQRLLREADLVLYAGSLVNRALLDQVREGVPCYDTAKLTLEQTIDLIKEGINQGQTVVRLHTGDPSLYGAIQEQIEALAEAGITYQIIPGVSSFLAAASLLEKELTIPGGTQTVILTRQGGRTPVPASESLRELAAHHTTLCLFLSAGLLAEATADLLTCLAPSTPAAIVARASWPDQRVIATTLARLPQAAEEARISKTALIFVGEFLQSEGKRSLLYDPAFSHGYRRASQQDDGR